jgi:hypothetical protein
MSRSKTHARLKDLRNHVTSQAVEQVALSRVGPPWNLLIADDAGLGKTIEAGLVARELLLRRRIDLIVISAPAAITDLSNTTCSYIACNTIVIPGLIHSTDQFTDDHPCDEVLSPNRHSRLHAERGRRGFTQCACWPMSRAAAHLSLSRAKERAPPEILCKADAATH